MNEASHIGTKTKVKKMRTASGIKDTYQDTFLDALFDSYKDKRGKPDKEAALAAKFGTLPPNTTSPVWRIKGEQSWHRGISRIFR